MDTSELRRLADEYDDVDEFGYARQFGVALRQAADEIDRLRAQIALYHDFPEIMARIGHANRERDEARSIISLVRSLLSEDGVKDSLAHLSVFHVLLARVDLSPTGLICYHTKAPCESPEACDAQQACARS